MVEQETRASLCFEAHKTAASYFAADTYEMEDTNLFSEYYE